MEKNKKTILITGGAGFIGSHLCEYFVEQGQRVICVDAFLSGEKKNISHLLKRENFQLFHHNIIYPFKKNVGKIDEIYNLACPASPLQYQFDPFLTLRTNVDGMRNMLNLALRHKAKILQTSTSEVYGDPLEYPQKESYFGNVDPLGKRSCYDEGKRVAETLCKDYWERHGVDARIVRLFNIYGPRMMFNDGRVVSNFMLQALTGEDITVYGTGEQSRSFMYISDLIVALERVMALPKEKWDGRPLNLGNPEEITIKDLAFKIKEITNSSSKIIFIPYEKVPSRLGDPQRRCPDISRARQLLNWEPKVSFSEGLQKTVADFRARLKDKEKVLVFLPFFAPQKEEGGAEKYLRHISENLSKSYDFKIIAARLSKDYLPKENFSFAQVKRVGWGNKFLDKIFYPFLAYRQARKEEKNKEHNIVLAIMASYGALAAWLFTHRHRKAFGLVVFASEKEKTTWRRKYFRPLQRLFFSLAFQVQAISFSKIQDWRFLEEQEKKVELLPGNEEKEFLVKRARELFQNLEIASAHKKQKSKFIE